MSGYLFVVGLEHGTLLSGRDGVCQVHSRRYLLVCRWEYGPSHLGQRQRSGREAARQDVTTCGESAEATTVSEPGRLARHLLRLGRGVMAAIVKEIMNRELLSLRPDLPAHQARDMLRSFGVGAAPVIDDEQRLVGVLTLHDLLEADGTTRQRMSSPAVSVTPSMPVEDAARFLVRGDLHHLIVVDATGAAVGMLSTLDVLRAMLGMPAHHPATFPHWDASTETSWTDDWSLVEENLAHAPDAPGVLVLVNEQMGRRHAAVWVEPCANLRYRVSTLIRGEADDPGLVRVLSNADVCFRASAVEDDAQREHIARLLRDRLEHVPPPGAT
jgi:CBS domain-containing protein